MYNPAYDVQTLVITTMTEVSTVEVNTIFTLYQVTVLGDSTTGTITLTAKARRGDTFEPVVINDAGDPAIIDLSGGQRTMEVTGSGLNELQFTPSLLDGSSYQIVVSCGNL